MKRQPLHRLPNGNWIDLSTVSAIHYRRYDKDTSQSRVCLEINAVDTPRS